MNVTLEIQRYNPEVDAKPYMQEYKVTAEPTDRVLDALIEIWRNQDGSLVFRKSCAHGVCGSDAMRINGVEKLACKTLIKDVVSDGHTTITIEPLKHLDVQRDLMVDQEPFFQNFRSVKPYLMPAKSLRRRSTSRARKSAPSSMTPRSASTVPRAFRRARSWTRTESSLARRQSCRRRASSLTTVTRDSSRVSTFWTP